MNQASPISLSDNSRQLRAQLFADAQLSLQTEDLVRLSFDGPLGRGQLDFIEFHPDFNIIISNCHFARDGALAYVGEGWLRFNFCLDATAEFSFTERGAFPLRGCQLRMFRQPEGVLCEHRFSPGRSVCATISIRRGRLRALCGDAPTESALAESTEQDFFFRRLQMSSEAVRAVQALLTMPYTGALRRLYGLAKSEELLVAALSAAPVPEASPRCLRDAERRRLEDLAALLRSRFAKPPALAELARRCGMNRNKLTVGFRELHGCSIGEYVTGLRLEAARRQLEASDLSVSEIAAQVGYEHVQSFSSAFRRHFGASPSSLRRRRTVE